MRSLDMEIVHIEFGNWLNNSGFLAAGAYASDAVRLNARVRLHGTISRCISI